MINKAKASIDDTKILIQFFTDKLELEKDTLSAQQRAGYSAKINTLQSDIDFNTEFIRYNRPLL